MEKRAVVDRIVDRKHAVLLVGTEEKEMIISADRLPEEAGEGSVICLTFEHSELNNEQLSNVKATCVDGEDRDETHQRIQSKMNRLQARKGSKFKKSTQTE